MTNNHTPEHLLAEVFGYAGFRGDQRAVIETVLGGGNALVIMPTGGGKSLCYQIPALAMQGTAVVVSPLIALMRDQVATLRAHGIAAAHLSSQQTADEQRNTEGQLVSGELDILYVAPERLLTEGMLRQLDRSAIALIAIDEAHCVSQWGHDFRPEYLRLDALRRRYPNVPRLALTATADARTRDEIAANLFPDGCERFIASFDRPNIRYRVGLKDRPKQQLLAFLRQEHPDVSGIVYCMSRRGTESVADWLAQNGINATAYHAGLESQTRDERQERFLREEDLVVVATVAFGMGIDKPDVRFVAHLDLPKSIEAYYQETGRAGRDGLPADAWMVFGFQDVTRIRQFIADSDAEPERKAIERERLESLLAYCEAPDCRRRGLLAYFGESHPGECGHCDNCLNPPQRWDATQAARKALSAIYRTGQRFGAAHVVDVLLGRPNERISRLGHDQLSTFGVGDEHDKGTWQSILRQLMAAGHIDVDPDGHGGLRLSPSCRPLLRGEQQLYLRRDQPQRPAGGGRRPTEPEAPPDSAAWHQLRRRRREIADAEGVAPYIICHDRSLMALLNQQPQTLAELNEVPGFGHYKCERYGPELLAALKEIELDPAGDDG